MSETPYTFSQDVARARALQYPLVALESALITHGLPRPHNLEIALEMEAAIRAEGAVPATIALLDGKIRVGMSPESLHRLAHIDNALKISLRDFAIALMTGRAGGTTVAATLFAAHQHNIPVFATGGIGGVHYEARLDISTDLKALAETPMIVVCAGAKSILDLPATLEYLETAGVPVIGYQTSEFPAFFSRKSGLPVSARLESPAEVIRFAETHWGLGLKSAVLVCLPVPAEDELNDEESQAAERLASAEALRKSIRGQALTPFLLQRINELTSGRSTRANLALLKNNARLAGQIATAITRAKVEKLA